MPPKNKYTSEQIIECAVELTRECGYESLTARGVGKRLGISSQPVYTAFENMDELKKAVVKYAEGVYERFCVSEKERGEYPAYKCYGMAYVRFAMEEKELFRLLYMRDRKQEDNEDGGLDEVVGVIEKQTGLDSHRARQFHLEMWSAVHGIAAMIATGYHMWSIDDVSRMLTDVYTGLRLAYASDNKAER